MKKIFFAIAVSVMSSSSALACTLWGAVKPNEIVVAKTRDFYPGNQIFKTVTIKDTSSTLEINKKNYRIFGLYAEDHGESVLKMGINEAGLVAFVAFASSVPQDQRIAKNAYHRIMETTLAHYEHVTDILNDSASLFKDSTPVYYLFADRQNALLCEVGLNNHYQCKKYSRAESSNKHPTVFAQTNHYIFNDLKKYNFIPPIDSQSSYRRLTKINELMQAHLQHLSLEQFIKFSLNTEATNDAPLAKFDQGYDNTYQDNSIFRTFDVQPDRKNKQEPSSARGLAAMIVELPRDATQPVRLYLRMTTKITNINSSTQKIEYQDTIVSLKEVLDKPNSISYHPKFCTRTRTSSVC